MPLKPQHIYIIITVFLGNAIWKKFDNLYGWVKDLYV
jgi:hypothetical protein